MQPNSIGFFLVLLLLLPLAHPRLLPPNPPTPSPPHYAVISLGAVALLVVAVLIYRQSHLEQRRVEFTVFNSQYLGKDSTRSNSEHDFPNFDVEVVKPTPEESEEKSSDRRRRKRKVNKLAKIDGAAAMGELDNDE